MSDTAASLRRQIASASDLKSVVRTMKAMAAASISQYENAVHSLGDYDRTVQLGLLACFRQEPRAQGAPHPAQPENRIGIVVFGSDQGLVGQFNDILVDYVIRTLAPLPGPKQIWAVGERIRARLIDNQISVAASLMLPNSVKAITPLVGQILQGIEQQREQEPMQALYLFHNSRQADTLYAPVSQRMLPLDEQWRRELTSRPWPSNNLPEVMPDQEQTLLDFIREYLFVSLFRACAESLASENVCRLAAMQRAEKNISELLDKLGSDFHRLRQSAIDAELFDVVSGFEAYGH